jgi:hypothetical protein
MAWFRKKVKPSGLTREQALACTPVRNNVVSWQRQETGSIQIEYTLVLKPFLQNVFKRFNRNAPQKPPTRKLELDTFGSQVWEMLDGSSTTSQIVQRFAASHAISNQEAERSVTLFLRELGKRGLIALR